MNQSLECCARCEGSPRRAIKSAPADTRDDGVGEEGGTRRAAASVDAEAAANSAQPSADSGEGSLSESISESGHPETMEELAPYSAAGSNTRDYPKPGPRAPEGAGE